MRARNPQLDYRTVALAFIASIGTILPSCSHENPGTADTLIRGSYVASAAPPDTSLDIFAGWTLRLTDRSYTLHRDTVALFEGEYRIAADTLFVAAETGLPLVACSDTLDTEGTYIWTHEDDRLRLIAVEDPCERRRTQFEMSAYVPGMTSAPPVIPVPDSLVEAWHSYFGGRNVIGDSLVSALAELIDDSSEFMGRTGRAEILEFAADFFCATDGRKPGSPSYQQYGPCTGRVSETVEYRPFAYAEVGDHLVERGAFTLSVFRNGVPLGQTIGRYKVDWARTRSGEWRIDFHSTY